MNLAKLIQSNSVSGPRSSSGMIMTTKAVVGIVVVVALLVAASFIVFTPSIGAAGDPTTTKTVTQTQVLTSVVGLGNATTQGLNPEAIYSYANESVVTLQGVQTTTTNTVFGPQTSEETVLGSGFVIDYSNQYYVVTNYHVAGATSNLTLTFSGGNSYPAKVVGSDPVQRPGSRHCFFGTSFRISSADLSLIIDAPSWAVRLGNWKSIRSLGNGDIWNHQPAWRNDSRRNRGKL